MQTIFFIICAYAWFFFYLYWLISAANVKRTAKRTAKIADIGIYAGMILSFILIFYISGILSTQVIAPNIGLVGLLLSIAGFAFAVWARVSLGRNWSSMAEVKKNHELVQSGPYKIVRHPIYTGWLLAYLGTAIALGELRGFIGILFLLAAFLIKIHQEEKLMLQQFPKEYPKYKRKVKALIPRII